MDFRMFHNIRYIIDFFIDKSKKINFNPFSKSFFIIWKRLNHLVPCTQHNKETVRMIHLVVKGLKN